MNQIRTLDQKHEARMRDLREKEAKLEEDKIRQIIIFHSIFNFCRYERDQREKFERTLEMEEQRIREQQLLLEKREIELKQKIQDLIEEHKKDRNKGTEGNHGN